MELRTPLDFALAYAKAGFRVFPCKGKRPRTKNGAHDASTDVTKITRFWTQSPDANIGLTLDGLVAVDIDPRNGGDVASLPRPLPETCCAQTGGGGLHHLYRAHNGTRYPGKLGNGIDLKSGAGSYIIVAPSVHASGKAYHWVTGTEPWTKAPAEAPEWLARPSDTRAEPPPNAGEDVIGEGGRNAHLASVAGAMRRRGASPDAILAALHAENAACCAPPLTDDEVAQIAKSIGRYPPHAASTTAHEWPAALDLAALAARAPRPPKSIMAGLPCGYVTETFAHGGTGKSQIELMRAVCIAAGVPFCGLAVEQRKLLYLSCEDREDILHWRLSRICTHLGVDLASLAVRLKILDLVGHGAVLFAPDLQSRNPLTTAYGMLAGRMAEYGTEVLIVDGITDVFGGNENARAEVKQFINELLALIPPETGAVLLIGHIDKATARGNGTSEGYSGSTAWHNSARARWFLYPEAQQDEDGRRAARTGKLTMELQKANHGEVGMQIEFTWDDNAGLFVGRLAGGAAGFDRQQRDLAEQRGILLSVKACAESNPAIVVPAATTGQRTAFNTLAQRPEFPETLRCGKPGRTRFWRHIEALRQMHAIEETSYRRVNRHLAAVLGLTTEGLRQCVEC